MGNQEDGRANPEASCSYKSYLRLIDPRARQQNAHAAAPGLRTPTADLNAQKSLTTAATESENAALAETENIPPLPTFVMTTSMEPVTMEPAVTIQIQPEPAPTSPADDVPRRPKRVSTLPLHAISEFRGPRRVSTEPMHTRKPGSRSGLDSSDSEEEERAAPLRRRRPTRKSTVDSSRRRSGSRSGAGARSPAKDLHLRVPVTVDDYESEAEMSGLDDYYRPAGKGKKSDSAGREDNLSDHSAQRSQRPISRQRPDGSDDDGVQYGGGKREVYDSDLESVVSDAGKAAHAKKMRRFKALAKNNWERMLLDCIVNTDSIPPKYSNVHVDPKIIAELERVTKMSLLRPKAYSHGILAGNKVTGAVLYGPPGTGKSLLAKATARESGFNMILASTAELWQKCHGDDEKVIQALFGMARKMHPCIVFIDEADALLGQRKAGEKRHIRAMLNQFLMEWDGLGSGRDSPFLLLATNRPFDLDSAVLRRAPVRILLDLPNLSQRHGILELMLRGEKLAADVSAERLAKMTTRYTGSDLKNLCVAAATRCIAEQEVDTTERTLTLEHFQAAMVTVKATGLSRTVESEFNNFKKGADANAQGLDGGDD